MDIGLLVYPGCVVSGLFAFSELLEVANKRAGHAEFNVIWVGQDRHNVSVSAGCKKVLTTIQVERALLDDPLDALVIPGFWTNHRQHVDRSLKDYDSLISKLKQVPSSTQVWGYCTAVCLMASSGRMDNQAATATWWLADFVHDKYPSIDWKFSQTVVSEQNHITASGLNGYLPIAQSLIEQRCGKDVLRDIVELMIIPKPETSAQPFAQVKLMTLEDRLLREIYVWVEKTPAANLTISELARHLNQTERTLARKVPQLANMSVARFMRLIKLHQASELLIYSRKPINLVSDALGFSDDAAFRRTFKKVSSFTPTEYRQEFQR